MAMFGVDGNSDFLQFLLVVRFANLPQYFTRLRYPLLLYQPARAAWNGKQHHEKESRRNHGDSELPTPLRCAQVLQPNHVVRKVGKQNSKHNVELKKSDQSSAPA